MPAFVLHLESLGQIICEHLLAGDDSIPVGLHGEGGRVYEDEPVFGKQLGKNRNVCSRRGASVDDHTSLLEWGRLLVKELDLGHQELALAPVDHCPKLALAAVVNLPGVIFQESALEWDVSPRLFCSLGAVLMMMGVARAFAARSRVCVCEYIYIYIYIKSRRHVRLGST